MNYKPIYLRGKQKFYFFYLNFTISVAKREQQNGVHYLHLGCIYLLLQIDKSHVVATTRPPCSTLCAILEAQILGVVVC